MRALNTISKMGRFHTCKGMVERALRRAFLDSVLEMYDYAGHDGTDVVTAVTLKGILTLTINNMEHFTVRFSEVAQRAEDSIPEDSAVSSPCPRHGGKEVSLLDKRKRKYNSDLWNDGKKKHVVIDANNVSKEDQKDPESLKIKKQALEPSSATVLKAEPDNECQKGFSKMPACFGLSDDEGFCLITGSSSEGNLYLNKEEHKISSDDQTSLADNSQKQTTLSNLKMEMRELDSFCNVERNACISTKLLAVGTASKGETIAVTNVPILQSRDNQEETQQDSVDNGYNLKSLLLRSANKKPSDVGGTVSYKAEKHSRLSSLLGHGNIGLNVEETSLHSPSEEASTSKSSPICFPSQQTISEVYKNPSVTPPTLPLEIVEDKKWMISTEIDSPTSASVRYKPEETQAFGETTVSGRGQDHVLAFALPSTSSGNSMTDFGKVFSLKKEPIEAEDLPVDFTLPSSQRNREAQVSKTTTPVPLPLSQSPVAIKKESNLEMIWIEDNEDDDSDTGSCRQSPVQSLWYQMPAESISSHVSKTKEHTLQSNHDSDLFDLSGITSPASQRYDCPLCGEVFHTRAVFTSHLSSHRQALRRSCSICRSSTLTSDALLFHLKTIHGPHLMGLPVPTLASPEVTALAQAVVVPATVPYALNPMSAIASLVTMAASQAALDPGRVGSGLLEQLMMTYSGFLPCPVCQLMCPSKAHLMVHLRAAHVELLAGLLGAGSQREAEVQQEDDRKGESGAKEETDGEASTSSGSAVSCFDCSITFSSQSAYTQHCLLLHGATSAVSQGTCSLCRRAFDTWKSLQAHYLAAHGVTSFCERCKLGFTTTTELKAHHEATHGSESRGQTFTCDICSKAFYSQSQCSAHKRSHVSEKSFACQVCGSAFFKRGDLSKHFRTVHAPNRVFNCRFCGKKGTRMDNMRSHVKSHGKHMTRDEILSYIEEVKSA